MLQRANLERLPEAQQRCVINGATVYQQLGNGCPGQVLVVETFMDPTGYACNVLEYCEVGPAALLLEAVRKRKEPLSEAQVLAWVNDIALAVRHLHGIGLLHLNVGVNSVNICADGQAKLGGDFTSNLSTLRAMSRPCSTDSFVISRPVLRDCLWFLDFAIACQLEPGQNETDPSAISYDTLSPEILRLSPVGRVSAQAILA